jgi:hypothetical protein
MFRFVKTSLAAGPCLLVLIAVAAAADAPPPSPGAPLPPPPSDLFSPEPFAPLPPLGPFHGPHGFAEHQALPAPRELCLDGIAREAAMRSYIEVKLGLTAEQRPLWQHFAETARAADDARRVLCDKLPASAGVRPPTLPEALAMAQEMLSARLAELQQVQPAVAKLYEALTPEQRLSLDPPGLPRS